MRDLTNRQLRLRRRPGGLPSPEDFELTAEHTPVPGAGQVLVRTLLLSIDPAMRGWVAEGPNYVQAVPVGGVMRSFGLAEVVQSRNTRFREHECSIGTTDSNAHATSRPSSSYFALHSPVRIEPNRNGDGHVER
jgi:NADPH-dependent curcumin reductase CurA